MSTSTAPEYALSFSSDAVHLMQRPEPDAPLRPRWRERASAQFDAPDFRAEMARLRKLAANGPDARVALIIPDDQILYTSLTIQGDGDVAAGLGQALDGLTPYAVSDLAWDWRPGDADRGGDVRVAAVARQTLREAEAFARRHGFDADGFLADPADGLFPEPPRFADQDADGRPQLDLSGDDVMPASDPVTVTHAAEAEAAQAPSAEAGSGDNGSRDTGSDAPKSAEAEPDELAGGQSPLLPGADVAAAQPASVAIPAETESAAALQAAPEVEAASPDHGDDAALTLAGDEKETAPVSAPVAGAGPASDPAHTRMAPVASPAAASTPEPAASAPAVSAADPAAAASAVAVAAPQDAGVGEAAVHSGPSVTAFLPDDLPSAAPPAPQVGAAEAADAPPVSPQPADRARGRGRSAPPALPARAQAVLDRAAAARNSRAAEPSDLPGRHPGARKGIGGLLVMVAALLLGLLLIWAFVTPRPDTVTPVAAGNTAAATAPQTASAPQPAASAAPAAQRTGAQPAAPQGVAPSAQDMGAAIPPANSPSAVVQPDVARPLETGTANAASDLARSDPAASGAPQPVAAPATPAQPAGAPQNPASPQTSAAAPAPAAAPQPVGAGPATGGTAVVAPIRRTVPVGTPPAATAASRVQPDSAAASDAKVASPSPTPAGRATTAVPGASAPAPKASAAAPATSPAASSAPRRPSTAPRRPQPAAAPRAAEADQLPAVVPGRRALTRSERPATRPGRPAASTAATGSRPASAVPAAAKPAEQAAAAKPAARAKAAEAQPAPSAAKTTAKPAVATPRPTEARPSRKAAPAPAGSSRPRSRPEEGSADESVSAAEMTPAERTTADAWLADLYRQNAGLRRLAEGGPDAGRKPVRLAEARPSRRPGAGRTAIDAAVEQAVANAPPARKDKPLVPAKDAPAKASAAAKGGTDRPAAKVKAAEGAPAARKKPADASTPDAGATKPAKTARKDDKADDRADDKTDDKAADDGTRSASASVKRPADRPADRPSRKDGTQSREVASKAAVEDAIADAVGKSSATPGAVALSTPKSLIPSHKSATRNGGDKPAVATAAAPAKNDTRDDAEAQAVAAAAAASRRSPPPPAEPRPQPDPPQIATAAPDFGAAPVPLSQEPPGAQAVVEDQLQVQAAERARAGAELAEAQARAAAEARARAQVAAEERAAIASRGTYTPPEVDNEPDVALAPAVGTGKGQVASAATVTGMDIGKTQVVGIIGAGRASRGLIRLRSGKIVTVRLGDRIDGGSINSIGNGRISYVKAGRQFNLPILNGR